MGRAKISYRRGRRREGKKLEGRATQRTAFQVPNLLKKGDKRKTNIKLEGFLGGREVPTKKKGKLEAQKFISSANFASVGERTQLQEGTRVRRKKMQRKGSNKGGNSRPPTETQVYPSA